MTDTPKQKRVRFIICWYHQVNVTLEKVVLLAAFDDTLISDTIAGVLNLYSLIYPLANFRSKIYPPNLFYSFTSTNAYCSR